MTAVEDEKGIQSVIQEIASENGVGDETNEETQDENLNGDQSTDDDSNQNDGSDTGDDDSGNDETKQGQAFAAMRVELKNLRAELAALKEKGSDDSSDDSNDDDSDTNKITINETDSEEVKLLKQELIEMKKVQSELVEDKTSRQTQAQRTELVRQITTVRDKHSLNEQQLLKFADDAEKAGFILGQSDLSVDQIYTLVYQDDIIARAIKNAEQTANDDTAPGTGPGSTGSTGKEKSTSVKNVVSDVIKDLGL